jgi:hypothetical protein
VILGGDFALAREQVHDGMIDAAVPVVHFVG